MKDKEARYVSHKTFLTRCVQNRIIPNGLSINVEPTIGIHDEEFLDNWYKKLESFSLSLIEDIVKFCDKTLESVKTEASQTETELQQNTDKNEFDLIKTTIQRNEESTKRTLSYKKNKKFNYLKYKPKQNKTKLDEPLASNNITRKRSRLNLRRQTSKTNMNSNATENHTIVQKLQGNYAKTYSQAVKNQPRRNTSNISIASTINNNNHDTITNEQLLHKIKSLEDEIVTIKNQPKPYRQDGNIKKHAPVTATLQAQSALVPHSPARQLLYSPPKQILQRPQIQTEINQKNSQNASVIGRGQENMDKTEIIPYIKTTMEILSGLEKRFQAQLDLNLIRRD